MSSKPPKTGQETYRVRSFGLDLHGRAGLAAFCDLLMESASLHAHELGTSPALLLERGMTWFLAQLHLRVMRYPAWRESVTVSTWPADMQRLYAIRDFQVDDAQGETIAVASSSWLLIDVARRKPLRAFPPEIRALHPDEPRRALDETVPRLDTLDDADHAERFRLRPDDLDVNGHVNHVVYVALLVPPVPEGVRRAGQVEELLIEHKAECLAGDEVESRVRRLDETGFLHSLVRTGDGREVARALTRWAPPRERPG